MARNKRGQNTSIKPIEIAITKRLQNIARDEDIKLKAMVRDKLETELLFNVHDSFRPATKKGQEVREYNENHTHQKANTYHHTGLLLESIYAVITENGVAAKVRDLKYDNGASTQEVYDYLKFGTSDIPKKSDVFDYANGEKYSMYISQEPHNFEARTREAMRQYLQDIEDDIDKNGVKNINKKYLRNI